ncbi:hypothetical protein LINGRAHAP2_LOCUS831 [Linum grandiflorum]
MKVQKLSPAWSKFVGDRSLERKLLVKNQLMAESEQRYPSEEETMHGSFPELEFPSPAEEVLTPTEHITTPVIQRWGKAAALR